MGVNMVRREGWEVQCTVELCNPGIRTKSKYAQSTSIAADTSGTGYF